MEIKPNKAQNPNEIFIRQIGQIPLAGKSLKRR